MFEPAAWSDDFIALQSNEGRSEIMKRPVPEVSAAAVCASDHLGKSFSLENVRLQQNVHAVAAVRKFVATVAMSDNCARDLTLMNGRFGPQWVLGLHSSTFREFVTGRTSPSALCKAVETWKQQKVEPVRLVDLGSPATSLGNAAGTAGARCPAHLHELATEGKVADNPAECSGLRCAEATLSLAFVGIKGDKDAVVAYWASPSGPPSSDVQAAADVMPDTRNGGVLRFDPTQGASASVTVENPQVVHANGELLPPAVMYQVFSHAEGETGFSPYLVKMAPVVRRVDPALVEREGESLGVVTVAMQKSGDTAPPKAIRYRDGMSEVDLQRELASFKPSQPIVVMCSRGDSSAAKRCVRVLGRIGFPNTWFAEGE